MHTKQARLHFDLEDLSECWVVPDLGHGVRIFGRRGLNVQALKTIAHKVTSRPLFYIFCPVLLTKLVNNAKCGSVNGLNCS